MRRGTRSLLSRACALRCVEVRVPPAARSVATARPLPPPPPPCAAAPASHLAAVVDVTDQRVLSELVASSSTTPLLLALYSETDAASSALLTTLAQLASAPASGVRLGLVEANELPHVAQALRVTRLPSVVAMHQQRVVQSLEAPAAGDARTLGAFVRQVSALGSTQPAQDGAAGAAGAAESWLQQGAVAVARALSSSEEEARKSASAEAAAAFAQALQSSDGATRAKALAGLAKAAACSVPRDLSTARELSAQARAACETSVPSEVASAEALVALVEQAESAAGDTEPADTPDAAAVAAHARALSRVLQGDLQGAIDDALWLVRKHREWQGPAGRALAVRLIEALGEDERAGKARRRLSSLWFA